PRGPAARGRGAGAGWVRRGGAGRRARPPAPGEGWSGRDVHSSPPPDLDVTWLELACWDSLDPADGAQATRAVVSGPIAGVAGATARPALRWRELSAVRASAKRFLPVEVPAEVLGRALSALDTRHATDLRPDPDFHLSLVTRSVAGRPPAVTRLTGGGAVGPDEPVRPDDLARACMHQDHLRDAAAFVVAHAPRDEVVGRYPHRLRELIFRAGAVGQLLYLGATEAGLGVTAVGGFDARRWRRIARLPGDHEVLYLVALGAGVDTGAKWDRAHLAYAHDER
ncbi:nitroreductase family protein, partial [Actinosynnema sp. NPDC059335]|uniref:nitroreductase family protein n=1 Tax=Actinosynnema sp. NPDC059335 TaxID=3346804 RepID=UPI003670206F